MTARVRFADMRSVTRSVTLPAPISATRMLAEVAEALVRAALADHPQEKTISLLAISVSNLEEHPIVQLELPIGLEDEPLPPRLQAGYGAVGCRPRDRCRSRSLRMGGHRLRAGRVGHLAVSSGRFPSAR